MVFRRIRPSLGVNCGRTQSHSIALETLKNKHGSAGLELE